MSSSPLHLEPAAIAFGTDGWRGVLGVDITIERLLPVAAQEASQVLRNLEPDDLVKYGLIPEFIGRIPVSAVLEPLDEQALEAILTEPRDALVKQFQTLLSMDSVRLEFQPEAVRAIAREAHRRKTGARALRGIIEDLMLDLMYDLPSQNEVQKFVITEELVDECHGNKVLPHPSSLEQQSA